MGVYEGYQKFRKGNGVIEFVDLEEYANVDCRTRRIKLKRGLFVGEHARSLIHEFLHLCNKHQPTSCCAVHLPKTEDTIEREMEDIYSLQPNLVNHLRKLIYGLVDSDKGREEGRVCLNMNSFERDQPLERNPVYRKLFRVYQEFQIPDYGYFECRNILSEFILSLKKRTMREADYKLFNNSSLDVISNRIWKESLKREKDFLKEYQESDNSKMF